MTTRSDKHLYDKVVLPIYRQLFKEAEPSADYDKLVVENEKKKFQENWFMDYYLLEERQEQIIDHHCKAARCSKAEKSKISITIMLGHSPTGSKSSWRKATAKKRGKRTPAPAKKGGGN